MSRRPTDRRRRISVARPAKPAPSRWLVALALGVVAVLGVAAWAITHLGPDALRRRAEAAQAAGDWPAALRAWRKINASDAARSSTWLGEARACLALDLAAQAETALAKASTLDPSDPEPWRLRLEILRVEGRIAEALAVGWAAYAEAPARSKRTILRELTLAVLLGDDDQPDDRALAALDRWATADPSDVAAAFARYRRGAALPRPVVADPSGFVATASAALARRPESLAAREMLAAALADAGQPDRARDVLDAWPTSARDARFWRLSGRLALDMGDETAASAAFERVLLDLPHDWRARAQLARALRGLERPDLASAESARVAVLRELLDPGALVPRLVSDFSRLDDPSSLLDLAALAAAAGLTKIAAAWRLEALTPPARPLNSG